MTARKAPTHILLAEDSEDDFLLLRRAFSRVGIKVPMQWVNDGQQAIDYLAGKGRYADRSTYPLPSFVLLDIKMPYRNGFEVLQWVRSRPDFKDLPVVVLSASNEIRDRQLATELKASSYLVKPSSMDELVHVVTRLKTEWLPDTSG